AVDAHAFAVQAQFAAAQVAVDHQAHAVQAGQVRGQHAEVVVVQAQFQFAGVAAHRLQRLAHQVGEQGRVGLVGAPEQAAGDAHRQLGQGLGDLGVEPRQRPGEAVEHALDLGD